MEGYSNFSIFILQRLSLFLAVMIVLSKESLNFSLKSYEFSHIKINYKSIKPLLSKTLFLLKIGEI